MLYYSRNSKKMILWVFHTKKKKIIYNLRTFNKLFSLIDVCEKNNLSRNLRFLWILTRLVRLDKEIPSQPCRLIVSINFYLLFYLFIYLFFALL